MQTHFRQLLNPPLPDHDTWDGDDSLQQIRQDVDNSYSNKVITDSEVRRVIVSVNSNKTPGPDGLCIELF